MFLAGVIRRFAAPAAPARCEQRAPEGQQDNGEHKQQVSASVDPLAAAAAFVGLPLFGATSGAQRDAVDPPTSPPAVRQEEIEVDGPIPTYSSDWERLLHHTVGLYEPQQYHKPHTPAAIAAATADFKQKLEGDDPRDACKYLLLEEFKCLQENQAHKDPENACSKCVKWFNEWRQCKWDQEKIMRGYIYADAKPPSKRKPYIAAPDYQYA